MSGAANSYHERNKTYLKLREEQYQAWMKEVQAEEAKNIDDLVSFNVISADVH